MQHSTPDIERIVKSAKEGDYAIPEFQRGFVWGAPKVRDLADSLLKGFPVGSLLTWKSSTAIERGDGKETKNRSWIIDGQQRTTALCTIFGERPHWWDYNASGTWQDHMQKFNVCLDVGQDDPTLTIRRAKSPANRYVPVREILRSDNLYALAQQLIYEQRSPHTTGDLANALSKVQDIKKAILPVIEMDDNVELTDVAEIFKRLNSTGTRIRTADIYLGVIAARNPGWINSEFLRYQRELAERLFEIEPTFIFRTLTIIGTGKNTFRDVPDRFWDDPDSDDAWKCAKHAWDSTLKGLQQYGIVNSDFSISDNGIVAATVFRDKFSEGSFAPIFAWLIKSGRVAYFSGQSNGALNVFTGAVRGSKSKSECIASLFNLIESTNGGDINFTAEEFIETGRSRNSVQRLMIYLLMYDNDGKDWSSERYRIRAEATGNYKPEWHHIFPRAWLQKNRKDLDNDRIDSVANMAVISGTANRAIGAKPPSEYIPELLGSDAQELLSAQAIPNPTFVNKDQYEEWLESRARLLADKANEFIERLRNED